MNLVASKKKFMEWIETQIKDDEFIVITNSVNNLSTSLKTNRKNVSFAFAADAFAKIGDVGHIAFGKTPVFALCICTSEHISANALKLIEEAENKEAKNG